MVGEPSSRSRSRSERGRSTARNTTEAVASAQRVENSCTYLPAERRQDFVEAAGEGSCFPLVRELLKRRFRHPQSVTTSDLRTTVAYIRSAVKAAYEEAIQVLSQAAKAAIKSGRLEPDVL
jgi:hypothetical protein